MELLISAIHFAARAHSGQLRKDRLTPYINHPLEVMQLLSSFGKINDVEILSAAVLHDTVEDTNVTLDNIRELFNATIAGIVEEVTDDKDLPREQRKKQQVERVLRLSDGAKLIRLADKISNVKDILYAPPANWGTEERKRYIHWTSQVVGPIRGLNPALEKMYDELLQKAEDVFRK